MLVTEKQILSFHIATTREKNLILQQFLIEFTDENIYLFFLLKFAASATNLRVSTF